MVYVPIRRCSERRRRRRRKGVRWESDGRDGGDGGGGLDGQTATWEDEEALPGEELLTKPIRRGLLAGAGATSLAVLLAACGVRERRLRRRRSRRPPSRRPSRRPRRREERTPAPHADGSEPRSRRGSPKACTAARSGSPGAERYQYPLDSEEGRAIAALRQLRQDGKAPGHAHRPGAQLRAAAVREGLPARAPSRHVGALRGGDRASRSSSSRPSPASEYPENLRNASTKNGSFDLVTERDRGDRRLRRGRAAAAARRVRREVPAELDSTRSTATPAASRRCNLFTQYKGSTYSVAFDNDTQPYFYRSDLLDERRRAGGVRGQVRPAARVPGDVGASRRRSPRSSRARTPTRRSTATSNTLAPFWGAVNWNAAFRLAPRTRTCSTSTTDGSANVNNEAGIRAFTELLQVARVARAGRSREGLDRAVPAHGRRQRLHGRLVPERDEARPGQPGPRHRRRRRVHQDATSRRAAMVDGALIRRPVIFYNICYGVNAFADPAHHEAAYLFLQWAGGARIYTWLTANPGGYQDPHHTYSLSRSRTRRRATSRSRSGSSARSSRARRRRSRSRAAAPTATRSARSSRRC